MHYNIVPILYVKKCCFLNHNQCAVKNQYWWIYCCSNCEKTTRLIIFKDLAPTENEGWTSPAVFMQSIPNQIYLKGPMHFSYFKRIHHWGSHGMNYPLGIFFLLRCPA